MVGFSGGLGCDYGSTQGGLEQHAEGGIEL